MTEYLLSVKDKDEDGGAAGGGGSGAADRSKLNAALSEVEKIEMYLDNATTRIIQTFKDTIVDCGTAEQSRRMYNVYFKFDQKSQSLGVKKLYACTS